MPVISVRHLTIYRYKQPVAFLLGEEAQNEYVIAKHCAVESEILRRQDGIASAQRDEIAIQRVMLAMRLSFIRAQL